MARQTPFQKQEAEEHDKLGRLTQTAADMPEQIHLARVDLDRAKKDDHNAKVEAVEGEPDRRPETLRALAAAGRRVQDLEELRRVIVPDAQKKARAKINQLVEANLAEVHKDALKAEQTIREAIASAVEAVDRVAAVAERELRWLERLRPLNHDGVTIGAGARLEGDLAGARLALAQVKPTWPEGVDRQTGVHQSPSERRQAAFDRQQAERDAAWAGFTGNAA